MGFGWWRQLMQNVTFPRPRAPWSISWVNFIYVILSIKIWKCRNNEIGLLLWRGWAREVVGRGREAQESRYFHDHHLSRPNSDSVSQVQFPPPNLISLFSKSLPPAPSPTHICVYRSRPSPHTVPPWLQSPAVPCICSSQYEMIIEWNASSYASEVGEWSSTLHCNYCSVEVT